MIALKAGGGRSQQEYRLACLDSRIGTQYALLSARVEWLGQAWAERRGTYGRRRNPVEARRLCVVKSRFVRISNALQQRPPQVNRQVNEVPGSVHLTS